MNECCTESICSVAALWQVSRLLLGGAPMFRFAPAVKDRLVLQNKLAPFICGEDDQQLISFSSVWPISDCFFSQIRAFPNYSKDECFLRIYLTVIFSMYFWTHLFFIYIQESQIYSMEQAYVWISLSSAAFLCAQP